MAFPWRLMLFLAIGLLLCVPTGMCVCAEHDDESPTGQHEPGCPEVRKLDRATPPTTIIPDRAVSNYLIAEPTAHRIQIIDCVPCVGHSPPKQPIYVTLQTLLI